MFDHYSDYDSPGLAGRVDSTLKSNVASGRTPALVDPPGRDSVPAD